MRIVFEAFGTGRSKGVIKYKLMEMQNGRYYMDGADLWVHFNIGVESGSDDFLKMPKRKDTISHNWLDENGLDVDLSRTFLEAKQIELKCHLLADNEAQFWDCYNRFMAALTKPGIRRITVAEFDRDFYCFYNECNIYTRFTRLKTVNKIACKFSVKLTERVPYMSTATFVIDDAGRFLIT